VCFSTFIITLGGDFAGIATQTNYTVKWYTVPCIVVGYFPNGGLDYCAADANTKSQLVPFF
jgi:hypothetical protein